MPAVVANDHIRKVVGVSTAEAEAKGKRRQRKKKSGTAVDSPAAAKSTVDATAGRKHPTKAKKTHKSGSAKSTSENGSKATGGTTATAAPPQVESPAKSLKKQKGRLRREMVKDVSKTIFTHEGAGTTSLPDASVPSKDVLREARRRVDSPDFEHPLLDQYRQVSDQLKSHQAVELPEELDTLQGTAPSYDMNNKQYSRKLQTELNIKRSALVRAINGQIRAEACSQGLTSRQIREQGIIEARSRAKQYEQTAKIEDLQQSIGALDRVCRDARKDAREDARREAVNASIASTDKAQKNKKVKNKTSNDQQRLAKGNTGPLSASGHLEARFSKALAHRPKSDSKKKSKQSSEKVSPKQLRESAVDTMQSGIQKQSQSKSTPKRASCDESKPQFAVPVPYSVALATANTVNPYASSTYRTYADMYHQYGADSGYSSYLSDRNQRSVVSAPYFGFAPPFDNNSLQPPWNPSKVTKRNLQTSAYPPAPTASMGRDHVGQSQEQKKRRQRAVPEPSAEYLLAASQTPQLLYPSGNEESSKQRLLVILDLNGTLLFRRKETGSIKPRPGVGQFLDYITKDHNVMIWSSATPKNVDKMLVRLFAPQQMKSIKAVWARDTLGLTKSEYMDKVQVYKNLERVWSDESIQQSHPEYGSGVRWTQSNTLLIDDSIEKAAAQPYNLVNITEMKGDEATIAWEKQVRVLHHIAGFLETVRRYHDVSAYLHTKSFDLDSGYDRVLRAVSEESQASLADSDLAGGVELD